jgi:hypothetical protein
MISLAMLHAMTVVATRGALATAWVPGSVSGALRIRPDAWSTNWIALPVVAVHAAGAVIDGGRVSGS